MVVNAVVPHLVVTIATRRYMPGTASALLFNFPLGCFFLERALKENFIEVTVFAWSGPAIALTILASIPLLFVIGRMSKL